MGRKVKCQITHEVGDSADFYKAPNGKYYKSEDVYNLWRRETEDRKECIRLICDYADYKSGEYAPTYLNKMLKEFADKVGYDVLLETIQGCEKEFIWANENKEFNNELGRLFYYKAIIGNKVVDVYKKHQRIKEQEKRMSQTPIEIYGDIDNIGCPTGGGKDLRNLLGEI